MLLAGAGIGGVALGSAIPLVGAAHWDSGHQMEALCLILFVAVLSRLRTPLPAADGLQTLGTVGHVAALLIFPLPLAIMVTACGDLLHQIYMRRSPIKITFNISL